jgi:predicted MPP superfamily phosphohydrolase
MPSATRRSAVLISAASLAAIAGTAGSVHAQRFAVIGDYGVDNANQAAVATRVLNFAPDFITTTGDNTYFVGANDAAKFANWDRTQGKYYAPYIKLPAGSAYAAQGAATNNFFPVLGNHDFDEGVASYSTYFDLPNSATATSGERYYSLKRGDVELFMLSADPREPDGRSSTSAQYQWARNAIRNSTAAWQIVQFHQPAYTYVTNHGPETAMRWPFQAWGVDAVFSGHNHNMQDMTINDAATGNTSLPYFVQGGGGNSLYTITGGPALATGNWSNATSFGFSMVDASASAATVTFYDSTGAVLRTRSLTQIPVGTEPTPNPTPTVTTASFGATGFSENFNSMGTAGTAPPTGFVLRSAAFGTNATWTNATGIPASALTGAFTDSAGLTAATTPSGTNNNGFNAARAAATTSDRVLATSPTTNAGGVIDLALVNDSGADITAISISYDIVRFTSVSSANELPGYRLFFSLNGGGTWTEASALAPTLTNVPNTVGVTSIAPTTVSLGGDWDSASTLLLRWVDDNAAQTSPDQIVGLDNLVVTAVVPEPAMVASLAAATVALFRRRRRA